MDLYWRSSLVKLLIHIYHVTLSLLNYTCAKDKSVLAQNFWESNLEYAYGYDK